MDNENICGTCRFHRKENGEWTCANKNSEYYSDYTEYGDSCEEHEER